MVDKHIAAMEKFYGKTKANGDLVEKKEDVEKRGATVNTVANHQGTMIMLSNPATPAAMLNGRDGDDRQKFTERALVLQHCRECSRAQTQARICRGFERFVRVDT